MKTPASQPYVTMATTEALPPPIRPRRRITGISAVLLPFRDDGAIDWPGFEQHVARTAAAGLTPAVNMDTGYVNLLDEATRLAALDRARAVLGGAPFVAGAFVADRPGDPWNPDACRQRLDEVQSRGAIPVVFQSHGLTALPEDGIAAAYRTLAAAADRFIAFELSTLFAPFGRIYSLGLYAELMAIPQCIGAKHSSLQRIPEWARLGLRDEQRPGFKVFTGNDLAIDMVMYGSDYLLGLSSFAPDLFGRRDRLWETGNPDFHELNDLLQYLGMLAFRPPVPSYKHSAAQFLKLRGWIDCDRTHHRPPTRPASDIALLSDIAERCAGWLDKTKE